MGARDIARGGLLAAVAFVLLYLGGVSPYAAVAACIAAGVTSAVPLIRHARVRLAVLLYLAVSVLSLLLVPRKSVAAAYVLFCGLYPIIKYWVECYAPRRMQMGIKLAYFNLMLLAAAALAVFVFVPQLAVTGLGWVAALWFAANAVFLMYDVALSRLIALLRRSLPPD
ncbi:hypothetical protein H8S45_08845 [Agathobaculum sp. NSJ-28]|uniref:Uncharacterized protein n=2 Tax=Agathobaculum TaxID=2048137 RepID=A0A923LUH4_9FIRM|nr:MULTISPECIES: hypothetical protein [Butyricicoccaceae]MBS6882173.1 hypothetical protein [Clostridiaceae bacterium]SCJ15165.1 Uncharacterised protein [uncultured Butyricicoccus sp.]MBC5725561.1 hypothetical protein [Agathobaculum faecis]MCU6789315.1 hypothetical protein [Agathobaculum ammoniilyticum]WOC75909.1 hypothetical protein RX717_02620 [Intestinibacillus sp. NTUH-41-i26]